MDSTEADDGRALLVHVAAEGLAPIIRGCAQTMSANIRSNGDSGTLERIPWGAINYFGPPIVEHWLAKLKQMPRRAQADAVAQLAALSAAEGHQQATAAVQ